MKIQKTVTAVLYIGLMTLFASAGYADGRVWLKDTTAPKGGARYTLEVEQYVGCTVSITADDVMMIGVDSSELDRNNPKFPLYYETVKINHGVHSATEDSYMIFSKRTSDKPKSHVFRDKCAQRVGELLKQLPNDSQVKFGPYYGNN